MERITGYVFTMFYTNVETQTQDFTVFVDQGKYPSLSSLNLLINKLKVKNPGINLKIDFIQPHGYHDVDKDDFYETILYATSNSVSILL